MAVLRTMLSSRETVWSLVGARALNLYPSSSVCCQEVLSGPLKAFFARKKKNGFRETFF